MKESLLLPKDLLELLKKSYRHMIAISKNVYVDALDDIVDKYNNIYHKTNRCKK